MTGLQHFNKKKYKKANHSPMFNHHSLIPWGSIQGWGSFRGRDHSEGCKLYITEVQGNMHEMIMRRKLFMRE